MSRKSKILSNAELSAFCQQISLIIAAGLPTYYGVSILIIYFGKYPVSLSAL